MIALKRIFSFSLLSLSLVFFFTACEKENLSLNNDKTPKIKTETTNQVASRTRELLSSNSNEEEGTEMDCFTFSYPFDLDFPDGTTTTINNEEELETALLNWFENNEESAGEPKFVYPIDVILGDGTRRTLQNDDELYKLIMDCFGDEDWDEEGDCFSINFPVDITFPDGTTNTINDEDALDDALDNWYENNENSDEDPSFVYPITVTLEDGTERTLQSEEEFDDLFEDCYDDYDDDWDCEFYDEECFAIDFPVDVIFPDGTSMTVNNDDDLEEALSEWYENEENEEVEEMPSFRYPISVVLEDGTQRSVQNDEELFELYEECYGGGDFFDEDCFSIQYPINLLVNGDTVTVNNEEEFKDFMLNENIEELEPIFPITVILENGAEKEINSEDELFMLYEECH